MKNLTLSLSLLKNKLKQKKEKTLILLLSVLISVLFVSTITYGATTIGSNINTGGTLTVSGNTTLGDDATDLIKSIGSFYASSTLQTTGAARFYSTLQTDGLTTLGNASTTQLSIAGNLWLNGNATTTSTGNIQGQGILTMLGTGTSTYSGGLQGTALNITSATASSTFANGIILSKGCFLMPDGTCVGGGGSGTINSGTTGQLSYYAGSGTTLTATSSLFLSSNQNIGIGTTTPNWLLQAAGTRPFFTLSDTGAAANNKHWFLSSQGGNFYLGTTTDAYATSTISRLTITSNGLVSIASSSPSTLLTIAGSAYFGTGANDTLTIHTGTVNYPISATTTIPQAVNAWSIGTTTNAGNAPILSIDGANGRVGIGTAASVISGNAAVLQITGNSLTTHELFVTSYDSTDASISLGTGLDEDWNIRSENDNDSLIISNQDSPITNIFTILQTGQIGISTTTPYAKLSIVGETVSTYFTATSTTATSTFLGAVGVGTSTPAEQLSVSGRLFVGGTGTSTIQNNLYVMGTLRSTVSYVGDLIFSNNFKFIETQPNAKVQSLFLQNQYGENLFKIDENGKLVVKEIEAERGKFREGNFEERLKTKNLQIGSPQNRTGITIYDEKTGKPYCLKISDGKVSNKEGECK